MEKFMKNMKKGLTWAALGGLLGYGVALAQLSAMDPVRVAPHIFQNVLENERVRVLKVTERNGERCRYTPIPRGSLCT
jgi:hypothetical protein